MLYPTLKDNCCDFAHVFIPGPMPRHFSGIQNTRYSLHFHFFATQAFPHVMHSSFTVFTPFLKIRV